MLSQDWAVRRCVVGEWSEIDLASGRRDLKNLLPIIACFGQ